MSTSYPHLLAPLKVGNLTFRNRIFTAPITLHSLQGSEPYPSEAVITHFANKAKGGAACVTCAGVSIFPVVDDGIHATYDLYRKNSVHYLAHLAERIHFYGAAASMELGVAGVVGGDYGASEGITLMAGNTAKEMPVSEMERIADGYAYAAGELVNAGFDMALLHFGHGLLVGQFLSPLTNHRTDSYGGSLENRARFPMMIIDRIREKVGRRLLLEVRISGREVAPGGIEVDEAIGFTKLIQDRIDLIHVSAGMHAPRYMTVTHPCDFLPPEPNVYLAEAVKKSGVRIPVVTIGGIQKLDSAEKILADGRADVVAIARGFIADPALGEKAYEGRGKDVTPCIKCMRCHDSVVYEYRASCSVNPEFGFEHELPVIVRPAATKKKVAVVGGGPAGMKAALVASERGHDVTLYEKNNTLGGTLKFSGEVSFKYDLLRYKNFLADKVQESPVRVLLNTEATPEMIASLKADVVIAAVGANPVIPPIAGMDDPKVVTALDAYGNEDRIGNTVVIIGGGQVGCETALHLARMGRRVTVLEMLDRLAPDASETHRTELLFEVEECEGLETLTSARCAAVNEKGVSFVDAAGRVQTMNAETVIVAAGMKARQEDAERFRESADRFVPIGDCVKAATVEYATHSAYYAAVQI